MPSSQPPVGILVLDKPAGISSAGLLNRLKRLLPRGTKLGHAGTLDPFATGVLLALVGKATKRCESLMGLPKTYLAAIRLRATTPTLDPESEVTPVDGPTVTEDQVRAILPQFGPTEATEQGQDVEQVPPLFSALKVGGRRAYDLARQGEVWTPAPRRVRVYALELVDVSDPDITVRLTVGRGYYVRSFARDFGAALGSAGYLTALRRERVGPFAASEAAGPDDLSADNLCQHLRPPPPSSTQPF